jgi:hypothetical protein
MAGRALVSGQATGWVLRHGPCTTWAQSVGVERDRTAQAVLVAIADAANRDGQNAHPGLAAMIDASGYARSTVFRALDRLVALGYVVIDEQGGGRGMATVYSIPGVLDDDWLPRSETVPLRDPSPAANGPADDAKRSRSGSETVPSSAAAPLFPTGDATERSNARDVEPIAKSPDRFDEFWRAYPKHVAKKQARAQWATAIKRADPQVLIDAAARYAIEKPPGSPYTLDPHRWLRDERWNDEPAPRGRATGSRSERSRSNLDRWYREAKERERQEQLDDGGRT